MTTSEKSTTQWLKHVFYFRTLSEQDREILAEAATLCDVKAGTIVFLEGEKAGAFYVVLSGQVKIFKLSTEGKELILHLFGPGEIFAEVPVFSGIPVYPANAFCMTDVKLLKIDSALFRRQVESNPHLALQMLSVFSQRLHKFNRLIEDLGLRNLDARLARYLLSVADDSRQHAVIQVQKKTLAAVLGTIPETLSRTFAKMVADELICVEGNTVELVDRDRLTQLAEWPDEEID